MKSVKCNNISYLSLFQELLNFKCIYTALNQTKKKTFYLIKKYASFMKKRLCRLTLQYTQTYLIFSRYSFQHFKMENFQQRGSQNLCCLVCFIKQFLQISELQVMKHQIGCIVQTMESSVTQSEIHMIHDLSSICIDRDSSFQSFESFDLLKDDNLNKSGFSVGIHSCQRSIEESLFYKGNNSISIFDTMGNRILQLPKIQKKSIDFKSNKLDSAFINMASDKLHNFCIDPSEQTFGVLLKQFLSYEQVHPFNISTKQISNVQVHPISEIFQQLFFLNRSMFLIYTFDFILCHFSFVCIMLFYWVKAEKNQQANKKNKQIMNQQQKNYKNNIINVLDYYIEGRSQQIDLYTPLLLVIYYFLNYLKCKNNKSSYKASELQKRLISTFHINRSLKQKQLCYSKNNNKVIFELQLNKYEQDDKLISSLQQTYIILKLITLNNFVASPIMRYYQLYEYEKSRQNYQHKKDIFCLWVLLIIVKICEKNNVQALPKAAYYIIAFMALLKKFRQNNNLQAMSYMISILENVKVFLPKLWQYTVNRRPQIQWKLTNHSEHLIKVYGNTKTYQYIPWDQKMYDYIGKSKERVKHDQLNLSYHEQFYQNFLKQRLIYRQKAQQELEKQLEKFRKQKQIGISLNIYILDKYLLQVFQQNDIKKDWNDLIKKCQKVNENISISMYNDFVDYFFTGTSAKFRKIDL